MYVCSTYMYTTGHLTLFQINYKRHIINTSGDCFLVQQYRRLYVNDHQKYLFSKKKNMFNSCFLIRQNHIKLKYWIIDTALSLNLAENVHCTVLSNSLPLLGSELFILQIIWVCLKRPLYWLSQGIAFLK